MAYRPLVGELALALTSTRVRRGRLRRAGAARLLAGTVLGTGLALAPFAAAAPAGAVTRVAATTADGSAADQPATDQSADGSTTLTAEQDVHQPTVRAARIGLPAPTDAPDMDHPDCAEDVADGTTACFSDDDDSLAFVVGHRSTAASTPMPHATGSAVMIPAGVGGQQAVTGTPLASDLGLSCTASNACTRWYSAYGSNCTHTYPNNDYYRNSIPTFASFTVGNAMAGMNCFKAILYQNWNQSGYMITCVSTTNCPYQNHQTYAAISWHYNAPMFT